MSDECSTTSAEVWLVEEDRAQLLDDRLATEEPLEIRLATDSGVRTVAVTMRTPGPDGELAAGFLYAEGVIHGRDEVVGLQHEPVLPGRRRDERMRVVLRAGLEPDLASLERHGFTTSACGLCGKASLDALLLGRQPQVPAGPLVSPEVLYTLPSLARAAQGAFRTTGGLHAAALFTAEGELLALREDVGRHNALDKLVGWALLSGRLPLHGNLLLLSGRASYELVQKAAMAEIPVVCAVSAPSSQAVAAARQFGITLIGFLRERRLNVYTGFERVRVSRRQP